MPIDFNPNNIAKISGFVSGKVIMSISHREGINDSLIFHFTDGSYLELEYDYICSLEYKGARKQTSSREFTRIYDMDTVIGMLITRNGIERMYYANSKMRRKRIDAITKYLIGE